MIHPSPGLSATLSPSDGVSSTVGYCTTHNSSVQTPYFAESYAEATVESKSFLLSGRRDGVINVVAYGYDEYDDLNDKNACGSEDDTERLLLDIAGAVASLTESELDVLS